MPKKPLLVVISGPSGVGKDAVLARLREVRPQMHFAVTATTRPPREGERSGDDYHFLSDAEFDSLLSQDGFLEHAVVYGHRYGVPKSEVNDALARGQDVAMRVDVQGAATIRRLAPDALFIFLAPASLKDLAERLQARNADAEETVKVRLATARQEMACRDSFDHVVVNRAGRLDDAVGRILRIIDRERRRRRVPASG